MKNKNINISGKLGINQNLYQLYNSKMNDVKTICNELDKLNINSYSHPFLLYVFEEEYSQAPVKIMIIGQETNGWGGEMDDIEPAIKLYKDFNMGRQYNTTFWKWVHRINQMLGNPNINCFVWNNILKFGKEEYDQKLEKGNFKGRPDINVTRLENKYFNVISDEISILKPEVCIFLTGPNYDNDIKAKFPDVEFMSIEDYPKREFAQLKSSKLPIHSYRTYHPGYGNRYKDWYSKIFEFIRRKVCQNK